MPTDKRREADIVVDCLRSAVMEGGAGLKGVPGLLRRTIDEDLWQERVILRTGEVQRFERFIDFVTEQPLEGLGADIATLKRLCSGDQVLVDMIDRAVQQGRGGKNNPLGINQHAEVNGLVQPIDLENGTRRDRSTRYLRTLRKDYPDLHKRVLDGKITVTAAAVEAGIYPKRVSLNLESVESAADTIIGIGGTEFAAALIDAIAGRLKND